MRVGRSAFVIVAASLLAVLIPATAWAAPPRKLPASYASADGKWQPAFDYDSDGCYPTPAIGPDGKINGGLKNSGALDGDCRDLSDLSNTNSYSRSKCNNGWCAYLYDLYFEKGQAVAGVDCCGHRHDIEHVVVWVQNDQAQYVSVSCHGDYKTYRSSDVAWSGTHARIVYHKDGASTHCFRLAGKNEQPENLSREWRYPDLVSWDNYPASIRDRLVNANFGKTSLAIKDSAFSSNLNKAKPSGISFNP